MKGRGSSSSTMDIYLYYVTGRWLWKQFFLNKKKERREQLCVCVLACVPRLKCNNHFVKREEKREKINEEAEEANKRQQDF